MPGSAAADTDVLTFRLSVAADNSTTYLVFNVAGYVERESSLDLTCTWSDDTGKVHTDTETYAVVCTGAPDLEVLENKHRVDLGTMLRGFVAERVGAATRKSRLRAMLAALQASPAVDRVEHIIVACRELLDTADAYDAMKKTVHLESCGRNQSHGAYSSRRTVAVAKQFRAESGKVARKAPEVGEEGGKYRRTSADALVRVKGSAGETPAPSGEGGGATGGGFFAGMWGGGAPAQ